MASITRQGRTAGFTLIEVLIAIVIFGIVIATAFLSYRAVFTQTAQLESDASRYITGKVCLERMAADLGSLYVTLPPAYAQPQLTDEPESFQVLFTEGSSLDGGVGRLQFSSMEHLPIDGRPGSGIARIVYYPDEDAELGRVIRRADDLYPFEPFEPDENDPILCRDVLSLTFTFIDAEEERRETWDSESRESAFATPRAVFIRLAMGEKERPVVFSTQISLPIYRAGVEGR